METLTMATTNPAKVDQIAGALEPLGISVVGLDKDVTLPFVDEDGETAVDNARKKALTYAKYFGKTVFSMDNALYIDGLLDENQPGTHVRRIGSDNERPTDEELLEYYSGVIASLGENVGGHWEFGVCIATSDGEVFETTIVSPRTFTEKRSEVSIPGYPLESIQIDPDSGKYISEMTKKEQALFWQKAIGGKLIEFMKSTGL